MVCYSQFGPLKNPEIENVFFLVYLIFSLSKKRFFLSLNIFINQTNKKTLVHLIVIKITLDFFVSVP